VDSRVDEQLAWEARYRPRAAMAALLAAVLTLGSTIYSVSIFSDVPNSSLVDALARVEAPGPMGSLPSAQIALSEWYSANFGALLTATILTAGGFLATGGVLTFLAFATGARRSAFPRGGLYVAAVGAVLMALGPLLLTFGRDLIVDAFLSGPRTVDAFIEPKRGEVGTAGQMIEFVGRVTLAIAFIIICLNAMRAGLLTRFLGVLGIIAGVLLILPIGSPLPVVQTFWLFAVGLLFLGRAPGGQPPAWVTGTAVPWPSAAEQRERGRAAEPAATAVRPKPKAQPEGKATGPSPATSAKKKRKRR
jgi:hypothetical protein